MRGRAELADFTPTRRLLPISGIAIVIGVLAAVVALVLLRLIGLVTNLCFFQRWDVALVSPAGHRLGPLVVAVPVAGGVLIGLMARFGSERIRGHFTRLPVVERGDRPRLVGMIALTDLLQARVRNLEAERRRERFLPLRVMRAS